MVPPNLLPRRSAVNAIAHSYADGRYRVLSRTDGRYTVVDYRAGPHRVQAVDGCDDSGRLRRDGFEKLGQAITHARNLERLTPRAQWGIEQ